MISELCLGRVSGGMQLSTLPRNVKNQPNVLFATPFRVHELGLLVSCFWGPNSASWVLPWACLASIFGSSHLAGTDMCNFLIFEGCMKRNAYFWPLGLVLRRRTSGAVAAFAVVRKGPRSEVLL